MKMTLLLLSIGLVCTVHAAPAKIGTDAQGIRKAQKLAGAQLTKDLKIEATKTADGICGAEGPSFIVQVKVVRLTRTLDEKTGEPKLAESWEVIKTYGIPAEELFNAKKPLLMDTEACLE